ncbi:putative phosphothreonine lyase domain-containing protein [uncultured Methanocorpusculum sp.]|nr:putative phosphothreonine lyase domain-containg protein [uncultured Methanocorpusculum sp.]
MTADDFEIIEEEFPADELADLAFGMFTIFIEKHQESQGSFLFREVESGGDIDGLSQKLMQDFTTEYAPLADSLRRFGTAQEIADLYRFGEGIIPSKTVKSYWIQQDKPGTSSLATGAEEAGKWLIFVGPEEVDAAWQKVRDATIEGKLGIGAKVSTAKENEDSHDDRKVIYVFTADWADEPDVMRVRAELKELGFVDRIGYKRNLDTYAGEYREKGKRVAYYSV